MSIEQEFLSKDIGHREQLDMFSSLRVVIQGKEGIETLEQSDNFEARQDPRRNDRRSHGLRSKPRTAAALKP